MERLEARLDLVYEDRLEGRIDAATYDQKAQEVREQQARITARLRETDMAALPSTRLAVDLMTRTSTNAQAFRWQSSAQQREFLELVVESATCKRGEFADVASRPG